MKNKLILYDIDGTLITSGGAGVRALERAFEKLFGISGAFKGISMAGKTDTRIMKEGLERHGLDHTDGKLSGMIKFYLEYLSEEINNPWLCLKPGIKESLCFFRETGTALGLLTGNLEKGAAIKLGPLGINKYFAGGAFGSDNEDRNKLLPVAIEKFTAKGYQFAPGDCIVIGDTPRDVRCAKIHGAYCIAVATGPYTRDDLLGTEADLVLDSLAQKDEFMKFVSAL